MTAMGVIIDQFSVPVCNSFQDKILNDQLCYEVDLEQFKNKDNIEKDLKLGLVFIMDYNEDRQVNLNEKAGSIHIASLVDDFEKSVDYDNAFIHLDTIGKRVQ